MTRAVVNKSNRMLIEIGLVESSTHCIEPEFGKQLLI